MGPKIYIVEKDGIEVLRTTDKRWYYKYSFETLSMVDYEANVIIDAERKTETLKLTKLEECD